MTDFNSTLLKKETIANGTMAFYFSKPDNFSYQPGQHASLNMVNPKETDSEGNSRTFSFISIPADSEMAFATRMRDTAFKRNLKNNTLNQEFEIKDPRGSMVLPVDTKRQLVFLAGGIGITPFMSMIRYSASIQFPHKIFFFYSNRTREDAPFIEELQQIAGRFANFKFIPTWTKKRPADQETEGESGYITSEILHKYIKDLGNSIYYVAGPSIMVKGMTNILQAAGIGFVFIKSEDFGEYK